jgi:hypothetical protein
MFMNERIPEQTSGKVLPLQAPGLLPPVHHMRAAMYEDTKLARPNVRL